MKFSKDFFLKAIIFFGNVEINILYENLIICRSKNFSKRKVFTFEEGGRRTCISLISTEPKIVLMGGIDIFNVEEPYADPPAKTTDNLFLFLISSPCILKTKCK